MKKPYVPPMVTPTVRLTAASGVDPVVPVSGAPIVPPG